MLKVSVVTLGVEDIVKSKSFFEALFGWTARDPGNDEIVFYDMGGWMLALYPFKLLAEDVTVPSPGEGFRRVTLAHNVATKPEVSAMLEKARQCGAQIIKPAQDVFWGGHSGYFQDLNGHYWEVVWNPSFRVLPDGSMDFKASKA